MNLKHFMVKCKNKNSIAAVDFVTKRLGAFLAGKWMKHEMVLKDHNNADVTPTAPANLTALTSQDKDYLKKINVLDAYEGVTQWQSKLQVTMVSGSSAPINPAKLAGFNTAPPSIREIAQSAQKKHEETFEKILEGKLDSAPAADPQDQQVKTHELKVKTHLLFQHFLLWLMNKPFEVHSPSMQSARSWTIAMSPFW